MSELVPMRKFRQEVPYDHRASLDTRLLWLWHQRFGTVQTIYINSSDILDRTACTLILQAIMAQDLKSIQQLFQRLEGNSQYDEELLNSETDEALRV